MSNILITAIFYFFAIFGAIQMAQYLIEMISEFFDTKSEAVIVMKVRNQEENIEGIIRSVVWRSMNGAGPLQIPTILVVDLDSTDDTPKILKRLCREYEFIKVTNRQGYIDFLADTKK